MDVYLQRQICERIKKARVAAGFTQQEMADLLEMTLRGYQNYESERVPFTKIGRIAALTASTEDWLLFGDRPASQEPQPAAGLLEAAEVVVDLLRSMFEVSQEMESALARIERELHELLQERGRAAR